MFFMYLIKEMPRTERPRERLMIYGAKALSNEELIAILFRTGTKEQSVMSLSKSVLYTLNQFDDIKKLTFEELIKIKGIKKAKAATLLAAIELGVRLATYKREAKLKIRSPEDVYDHLIHEIGHLDQEHFIVFYLNVKSEVIKKETLYVGTINQMVLHPREIFKKALLYSASALLFAHNHPTGDSTPSVADLKATEALIKTAEVMGLDVVDHLIIGHHEFYSIKAKKKIKVMKSPVFPKASINQEEE